MRKFLFFFIFLWTEFAYSVNFEPFFVKGAVIKTAQQDFPNMSIFDDAILGICGNWGAVPSAGTFFSVISSLKYVSVVDEIYQNLDGGIISFSTSLGNFIKEMTEVFFSEGQNGDRISFFINYFCGSFDKNNDLSEGLHFIGRYYEANRKWAGIDWKNHSTDCEFFIRPPIYSFPMLYFDKKKKIIKNTCKGGYFKEPAYVAIIDSLRAYKHYYYSNQYSEEEYSCFLEKYSEKYNAMYWKKFLFREKKIVSALIPNIIEDKACREQNKSICNLCIELDKRKDYDATATEHQNN